MKSVTDAVRFQKRTVQPISSHRLLYHASIVGIPILVAVAMPLAMRAYMCNRVLGWGPWESLVRSLGHLGDAMHVAGFAGTLILYTTYVFAHGLIIAVCSVLAMRWNPRRVYCVMAFGLLASIIFTIVRQAGT